MSTSRLAAAPWLSQAEGRAAGLHPPIAMREAESVTLHGDTRVDEYAWLRRRDDPAVLSHLEAENAYTDAVLAPLAALRERLYAEISGRVLQTDTSAPYRDGAHWYYARTEEGKQYPIQCRRRSPDGPEEVILDENERARGSAFFALGAWGASPDGALLAFAVDTDGSESYDLTVRDLDRGIDLPDVVCDVDTVAWCSDNRTIYYVTRDDTRRPYRLYRHRLGAPQESDELLYEETDALYSLSVSRTRCGTYLLVESSASTCDEIRIVRADDPSAAPVLLVPRRQDVECTAAHHDGTFYLLTNHDAPNFRIVRAPADDCASGRWSEVVPHRPEVTIEGMELFRRHLVVFERAEALPHVRVIALESGKEHLIEFPEPVYAVFPGANRIWDTATFRFVYQSFLTPPTVYDYDLDSRDRALVKRQTVLGGYRPEEYVAERITATAPDGTKVPVSLVYRRDALRGGPAPMYLTGYGAYGISWPVTFSANRLSLLERGIVVGIAHVRGGGDCGRRWRDEGRMLRKRNSFTDFIACAEELIASGYTAADRLVIEGGSAGGLLVGAAMNMRPELFRAVVAQVPFVDVLNTMLDASLPLTVGEYLEWGNPNEREYYDAIRAYCPYTNVRAQAYPGLLATVGLHDPRVSYWEGAKWVARLRERKTDDHVVLLRVNMGAGHQGASGRYDRWKEIAFEYAYILSQVGAATLPDATGNDQLPQKDHGAFDL